MVEEKMDLDPLLYLHLHLEGRKRETHTQDLGWFFEKNDQNLYKSYVFFFYILRSKKKNYCMIGDHRMCIILDNLYMVYIVVF